MLPLMSCDILAFGVHPDDIEIGIGGLISSEVMKGARVVMVDLTLGEMSSNGTPEVRRAESLQAALVMGVQERINLEMRDRGITIDSDHIRKITTIIRSYKPARVFYPYKLDRHPDHGLGASLIHEALWSSGLIKYECGGLKPHRPECAYMYFINDVAEVTVTYDISDAFEKKMNALRCHATQFERRGSENATYLNEGFLEVIRARDRYYGFLAGTVYAECLKSINLPRIQGFSVDKSSVIL